MKVQFSIVFAVVCIVPYFVFAQSKPAVSLSGQIVDVHSSQPIRDANIVVLHSFTGVVSDEKGQFTLKAMRPGEYEIRVSHIAYKTKYIRVVLSMDKESHLLIALEASVSQMSEFILRTEVRDSSISAQRVHEMSKSRIEALPVQRIAEALDFIPGIYINSTMGFFSSSTTVSMRGLPANNQSRVLILMDGIPLNKGDQGSVNWNLMNRHNVEKIRVIKGPGHAMYGSGSMGGVVEITSKRKPDRFHTNLGLEYGTFNTVNLNLNTGGLVAFDSTARKFYWNLNASFKKSDGYISEVVQFTEVADSLLIPVFVQEMNLQANLGYELSKAHRIDIQLGIFDDMRGNGFRVYDDIGSNSEHDTYLANFRYSGRSSSMRWQVISYFSHENYKRLYEYYSDGIYQLYQADVRRADMGTNAFLIIEPNRKHSITGGINYRLSSVSGKDIYFTSTDIISNAGKMASLAAFIQDDISLFNKRLNMNIGLRYEIASFYEGMFRIDDPSYSIAFYSHFNDSMVIGDRWDAFCPKLSIEYIASVKDRVYFSAGKGFTAPVLDDLSRTGRRRGGFKIANPFLKPELLNSVEVGYDRQIGKYFHYNLSAYYSIGKDFHYDVSTGDSVNMAYRIAPILKKDNISKVDICGFENELTFELNDSLYLFANYSFTIASIKNHVVNNPLVDFNLTGKHLTDIPKHSIASGILWKNPIVNISFTHKYFGETWVNDHNTIDTLIFNSDKMPDYHLFNIRFDKKINPHFSTFISVENVFNKIFITTRAFRCPGRFIIAGIKYSL